MCAASRSCARRRTRSAASWAPISRCWSPAIAYCSRRSRTKACASTTRTNSSSTEGISTFLTVGNRFHPMREGEYFDMTKLLDQALEVVRGLPPDTQDDIARVLLQLAGDDESTPV